MGPCLEPGFYARLWAGPLHGPSASRWRMREDGRSSASLQGSMELSLNRCPLAYGEPILGVHRPTRRRALSALGMAAVFPRELHIDIADRADAFAIPGPGNYPEPCPERASDLAPRFHAATGKARAADARPGESWILETWYMLFVASHSPGRLLWTRGFSTFQGGGALPGILST